MDIDALKSPRVQLVLLLSFLLYGTLGLAGSDTLDFGLFDDVAPLGDATSSPQAPADGVLLLQFWASWCHSCGSLMWDIDEIVSRTPAVSYIAISLDDDPDAAERYIRQHKLYARYKDRYFVDSDKVLSTALGIETVPSVLVVAPTGDVLLQKTGHLNSADLRDIVGAIPQQP